MHFAVVPCAEPPDVQLPGVVVVVRLDTIRCSTDLTGLSLEVASFQRASDGRIRQFLFPFPRTMSAGTVICLDVFDASLA